jgi:hypothetical protein
MVDRITNDDITNLLEKWHTAKTDIAELEAQCEKYKRLATKIMRERGQDSLSSKNLTLKRKDLSRSSLAKKDVPPDVWRKFSNSVSYQAFYLTHKKS